MQVEECAKGFMIVRGKERDDYFAFLVDHDKSSWTRYSYGAATFATKSAAEAMLARLRLRAKRPYIPCTHDEVKWGRKKEFIGGKEITVCARCREEIE